MRGCTTDEQCCLVKVGAVLSSFETRKMWQEDERRQLQPPKGSPPARVCCSFCLNRSNDSQVTFSTSKSPPPRFETPVQAYISPNRYRKAR